MHETDIHRKARERRYRAVHAKTPPADYMDDPVGHLEQRISALEYALTTGHGLIALEHFNAEVAGRAADATFQAAAAKAEKGGEAT